MINSREPTLYLHVVTEELRFLLCSESSYQFPSSRSKRVDSEGLSRQLTDGVETMMYGVVSDLFDPGGRIRVSVLESGVVDQQIGESVLRNANIDRCIGPKGFNEIEILGRG